MYRTNPSNSSNPLPVRIVVTAAEDERSFEIAACVARQKKQEALEAIFGKKTSTPPSEPPKVQFAEVETLRDFIEKTNLCEEQAEWLGANETQTAEAIECQQLI